MRFSIFVFNVEIWKKVSFFRIFGDTQFYNSGLVSVEDDVAGSEIMVTLGHAPWIDGESWFESPRNRRVIGIVQNVVRSKLPSKKVNFFKKWTFSNKMNFFKKNELFQKMKFSNKSELFQKKCTFSKKMNFFKNQKGDFFKNDTKIGVQKNHLRGQLLYRSPETKPNLGKLWKNAAKLFFRNIFDQNPYF